MRIVVSAQGENLEAPASPVFGRCPTYIFVDTDSMQFEALPNPVMDQGGGAGIQAAQFVVGRGAQAVLSGNLGPNAFDVLQAAGVPGYLLKEGTVRQAVEAFEAGRLQPMGGANARAHAGMEERARMGRGMGMGRGAAQGMRGGSRPPAPAQPAPPQQVSQTSPEPELAQLRETLKGLRQQLAKAMERIKKLEEEG
jgi:predicted Fe-Mo cluster-binding NifX family protein